MLPQNLFSLLRLQYYERNTLGAGDTSVSAILINDDPPDMPAGDSGFVILECTSIMGHPNRHVSHFYGSRQEMEDAFCQGMLSVLGPETPVPVPSDQEPCLISFEELIAEACPPSPFASHPGFIGSVTIADFGMKPWYMALDGDIVDGNAALSPS